MVYSFETSGQRDGPWTKGTQFYRNDEPGARTIGVWAIRSGTLCLRTVISDIEDCFEVYASAGQYFVKPSIPDRGGCFQGPVSIQ